MDDLHAAVIEGAVQTHPPEDHDDLRHLVRLLPIMCRHDAESVRT